MSLMESVLNLLSEAKGTYKGNGVNHEGQKFNGEFSIFPILDGKGASLSFSAIGLNGQNYHSEHSLIFPRKSGHEI